MDGKWVVDLSSPTEDDANGNKNNVVEQNYPVPAVAKVENVDGGGGGPSSSSGDEVPPASITPKEITTTAVQTKPSGWQDALQPFFGGRKTSASIVDMLPVVRLEASRIALDMKMRPMK